MKSLKTIFQVLALAILFVGTMSAQNATQINAEQQVRRGGTSTTLVTDENDDVRWVPTSTLQGASQQFGNVTAPDASGNVTVELDNSAPATINVNDADSDSENELQTLTYDPATGTLNTSDSPDSGVVIPLGSDAQQFGNVTAPDASGNVTVELDNATPATINVNDADSDSENELQTLTYDPATGTLNTSDSPDSGVVIPVGSDSQDLSAPDVSTVALVDGGQVSIRQKTQWVSNVTTNQVTFSIPLPTDSSDIVISVNGLPEGIGSPFAFTRSGSTFTYNRAFEAWETVSIEVVNAE